jgi:hypothetical protein
VTAGALEAFKTDTRNPDVISPSQITADQDNYNPTGFSGAGVVRLDTDASRNITGFSSSATIILKKLINVGENDIILKHQDVNSTASNRILVSAGVDKTLAPNELCDIFYDATTARWRVV